MTQYYAAAQLTGRGATPSTSRATSSSAGRGSDIAAWRRNQNSIAFRVQRGLGPVTSTVLVILLLSVLGLIYLTQITKTSTYGYELNDLEGKRLELQSEKADLQVESARLEALSRARQSDVAQAMTAPEQTDYLN